MSTLYCTITFNDSSFSLYFAIYMEFISQRRALFVFFSGVFSKKYFLGKYLRQNSWFHSESLKLLWIRLINKPSIWVNCSCWERFQEPGISVSYHGYAYEQLFQPRLWHHTVGITRTDPYYSSKYLVLKMKH